MRFYPTTAISFSKPITRWGIEYCKQHLASYKKPRSVDFVDSLPRNAIGKVLKRALKEQYGKSVKYE